MSDRDHWLTDEIFDVIRIHWRRALIIGYIPGLILLIVADRSTQLRVAHVVGLVGFGMLALGSAIVAAVLIKARRR